MRGTVSEPETALPPSGEGTVVLDIGGDLGAAAVFTPASLAGSEIEIRPAGEPWAGVHTGVRRRDLRDGACFAAVFAALPVGRYQLRVRGTDSGPVMDLAVTGGTITEDRWPDG
jgi:hypothetical protein